MSWRPLICLLQDSQLRVNDYIQELHTATPSSIECLHCTRCYGEVHTTLLLCSLVSVFKYRDFLRAHKAVCANVKLFWLQVNGFLPTNRLLYVGWRMVWQIGYAYSKIAIVIRTPAIFRQVSKKLYYTTDTSRVSCSTFLLSSSLGFISEIYKIKYQQCTYTYKQEKCCQEPRELRRGYSLFSEPSISCFCSVYSDPVRMPSSKSC